MGLRGICDSNRLVVCVCLCVDCVYVVGLENEEPLNEEVVSELLQ